MNILQFDFIVDKSTNTVLVTREFDAELPLVWDAFTSKEILDQWWAPKPFESKTKVMNFELLEKLPVPPETELATVSFLEEQDDLFPDGD